MSTYTLVPASRTARAASMLTPCSSLYWFSKPPAAARVVASAEKKMLGGGAKAEIWLAHLEVSLSMNVVSLACGAEAAMAGVRREIVSTRETAGLSRRLLRMKEPCSDVLDSDT